MMPQKSSGVTSTPFAPFASSHDESEDLDSGYHSNLSVQSKSRSVQTPDTSDNTNNFGDVSRISTEPRSVLNYNARVKFFRLSLHQTEHVDFLYHLGERTDHLLIVRKIFENVDDEDLYTATQVSKTWKKVILSIPTLRRKFRLFARKVQLEKENPTRTTCDSGTGEEKSAFTPRSWLTEIQNKRLLNSQSPQPSPSTSTWRSSNRFEAFQIEAQRVKIGKRLYACPRCQLPSQVDEKEVQTAVCTSQFCRYRFCILCHCEAHPSRVCRFISTPTVRKQGGSVGSKYSKKNLKRLLL